MRVIITRPTRVGGKSVKPKKKPIEVSDRDALALIAAGKAIKADEKKTSKPEPNQGTSDNNGDTGTGDGVTGDA